MVLQKQNGTYQRDILRGLPGTYRCYDMKSNQERITRNEYTRKTISGILKATPKDTIVKTEDFTAILLKRYRGVTNHNVGNLLRERDDVVWVTNGTWRVKK